MEEDLKDGNIKNVTTRDKNGKSKGEDSGSVSRRQILNMGWSIPVGVALSTILPKVADSGVTHVDGPPVYHGDSYHDDHGDHVDHHDMKGQPASQRIYPIKQSLTQNLANIRQQINALQAQLNSARDGQNLTQMGASKSALKIREALQAISGKISTAGQQNGIRNIKNLSNAANQGVNISLGLEKAIKSNQRSAALQQLNQLNKSLGGLQKEINGI